MATYSFTKVSDGKYQITVKSGYTLSEIASEYNEQHGGKVTYQQLATWNNIANANRIYVNQVIKCYNPSSSGGSSGSSASSAPTNVAVISHFGKNAADDNELIAEWTWSKESQTESYKVEWGYANGSGVWLGETLSTNTVDDDNRSIARQATYSIPSDATRVRFRVKPIAKKKKDSKGKETAYWTASWTSYKYYDKGAAPAAPSITDPKVEGATVSATVSYDNVDLDGVTHVQFRIEKLKNNKTTAWNSDKLALRSGVVSWSHSGDNDSKYRFCARAYIKSRDVYSEWCNWTDWLKTKPVAPSGITALRAKTSSVVFISWGKVNTASKYEIQYTKDKTYFGMDTDQVSKEEVNVDDVSATKVHPTSHEINVETGDEYFFRVRAVNSEGIPSHWTGIKSVVVGKKPAAPTTWSSTSKAYNADDAGADVKLYWTHNSQDSSRQSTAKVELKVYYGDRNATHTVTIGSDNITAADSLLTYTKKTFSEEDPEPTYECVMKTSRIVSEYSGVSRVEWRVQTKGVTNEYGDWSTTRTIDIYEKPTLSLEVDGVVTGFPFDLRANAEPKTDTHFPTGYSITITASESYETVDNVGNVKMVNVGDTVYSSYSGPDSDGKLELHFLPSFITLENGMNYRVSCVASMSSGLTVTATTTFSVDWTISEHEPTAEIGINKDLLTASIRPYCETVERVCYEVKCAEYAGWVGNLTITDGSPIKGVRFNGEEVYASVEPTKDGYAKLACYTKDTNKIVIPSTTFYTTNDSIGDAFFGERFIAWPSKAVEPHEAISYVRSYDIVDTTDLELIEVSDVTTVDDEPLYKIGQNGSEYCTTVDGIYYSVDIVKSPVYIGMNDDGQYVFFTTIERRTPIYDVYLSVYRREFDGSFTEIATNLDAANRTTVTDPHPALDYARYRIVATDKTTGHVEYYDCPGYPVGGIAAVLQWDEEWRNFDALGDIAPAEPELSGSMLKLPYNIDVSDNTKPEVTLVEYIGRSHPVSYYGTQIGSTSSWSMVIDKKDTETLYALRRLSRWLGDVYVREPSGSGYWAQVTVSFSQTHCEVTIPVSLSITRVEGGA